MERERVGHRLSKIYTRTGDDGTTGLADGTRIEKDGARIEAMGAVDELNSLIAGILIHGVEAAARECLVDCQHALFDIGGELAIPGAKSVTAAYVERLEGALDGFNVDLPPLKEFILPGGGNASVAAHVARAACRRAERRLVALSRSETINEDSLRYLNRLSDLLFVLARSIAIGGEGEVYWQPGRHRE